MPYTTGLDVFTPNGWEQLTKTHEQGFFEWQGKTKISTPCKIRIHQHDQIIETYDVYSFAPMITNDELHLFGEGNLKQAYKTLGAQLCTHQGVDGVRFAVWAPNAERVSLVGSFNNWDGRVNPMRVHGSSGVWEIFIPRLKADALYKFEICQRHTGNILVKTDPYGFCFEARPGSAAKVSSLHQYQWQDQAWLKQRA